MEQCTAVLSAQRESKGFKRMISFDSEGWIRGSDTVCEQSPFFDDRQADCTVNLVVMHNISLPAGVFGLGYVRALFRPFASKPKFKDSNRSGA